VEVSVSVENLVAASTDRASQVTDALGRKDCEELPVTFGVLPRETAASDRETVVVVEPAWTGHHPLYFRTFCETISQLGDRVFGICPKPEEMEGANFRKWSPPSFDFRPRRLSGPLTMRAQHWWLPRRLRALELEIGAKIDLVFFSCLFDRYLALHPVDFPWAWAGLYLHASGFRIPADTKSHPLRRFSRVKDQGRNRLRGLAVLDEGAVDFVSQVSGCENVVAFPDFSETTCNQDCEIAAKLRGFAAGHRVIGIAGHLQPSKGTVTLAQAALRSQQDGRREIFAFVGELWWALYSEADREILRSAFAGKNVFTHFERIPREEDFNAVLQAFDVIYAGYHSFPHSSNMPAKAAGLRRPMIVSEGYLLGDRVSRFRLGKVIPQCDVDALLNAIRETEATRAGESFERGACEYLRVHSIENLQLAMGRLLSSNRHIAQRDQA
jgi:hypothetical protein